MGGATFSKPTSQRTFGGPTYRASGPYARIGIGTYENIRPARHVNIRADWWALRAIRSSGP